MNVYFKYTSESEKNTNAFQKQIQSILEVYVITKFLMDPKYKWKVQSIFKIIFQLFSQSCKLSKSKFCPKVYLKYTSEVYLKYSLNSAGENTSRGLHNLWGNGLVVRVQGYQTRDPTFETIRWLKNWLRLSHFKDSWGLGG